MTDINNNVSEEEIRNSINMYKNMLITNDKLMYIQKNPEDYPNLNESIELFSELEEKVYRIYSNGIKR